MSTSEKELKSKLEKYENCEYIIYQIDAENQPMLADEKCLDEAYKILSVYSFPMNTNPLNKKFIGALSKEEQAEMDNNEYQFVKKKLAGINKSLRIIAIPKTLYQVFYLKQQFEEMAALTIDEANARKYKAHHVKPFNFNLKDSTSERNIYKYAFDYMQDADVITCWKNTNNAFIKRLCKELGKEVKEQSLKPSLTLMQRVKQSVAKWHPWSKTSESEKPKHEPEMDLSLSIPIISMLTQKCLKRMHMLLKKRYAE